MLGCEEAFADVARCYINALSVPVRRCAAVGCIVFRAVFGLCVIMRYLLWCVLRWIFPVESFNFG